MMERRPTWPAPAPPLHRRPQPDRVPFLAGPGEDPDWLGEVDAAFDAFDDGELDVLLRAALGGRRTAAPFEGS